MPSRKVLNNMDIYSPSFDHFVQLKIETINRDQLSELEDGVQWKIGHYKSKVIAYLSLAEKMHILSIGFGLPVFLCTYDEEKGLTKDLFDMALKAKNGKIKNSELLDELMDRNVFVLSDRQVMDSMLYMNHAETSEIYNLFRMLDPRGKSKKELKYVAEQNLLSEMVGRFLRYEKLKKKVLMQFKMNQTKLYGLLYFFDGEKLCRDFYEKAFKHAYISSRFELSRALAELYRSGHLTKRGNTKELKYSITSKGIDLLVKILNKLLYDV